MQMDVMCVLSVLNTLKGQDSVLKWVQGKDQENQEARGKAPGFSRGLSSGTGSLWTHGMGWGCGAAV